MLSEPETPARVVETKVEVTKRESHSLRGSVAETLGGEEPAFGEGDATLLKFHGVYQQSDRDQRSKGAPKLHSFMVRAAIPAGILSAKQYLALDDFAGRYANGTLRVTTRQGIQFHGVLKENLKPIIAEMNANLVTTLSACGDVARNLMACAAPLEDRAHLEVQLLAKKIAAELRPATRAYHEIWLDGESVADTKVEEPFYGDTYLPRKFKAGVSIEGDNCVDIYSYDAGLIAIVKDEKVVGFNLVAGGGQGMTHNKPDTFARLAWTLGFVPAEKGVEAVREVAAVFRDFGNRGDRRHARLKYLIKEWGVEKFVAELQTRLSFKLEPAREQVRGTSHDHLGRHKQCPSTWFYGLYIESGRIADRPGQTMRSALRQIVTELEPGIRLTGQQNLLVTDLDLDGLARVEAILREHGVPLVEELSGARRFSQACPALPTCGLALAESERYLPTLLDGLEPVLQELKLEKAPFTVRMTGCPNGCARPYTADLAFVGRSLGLYNIYVGGHLAGDRLADLYASDVASEALVATVTPLLEQWAAGRQGEEGLGDFFQRQQGNPEPRQELTGKEIPLVSRN